MGLALCAPAVAQPFNRLIGAGANESANGVAATRDGGYVTVGAIVEQTAVNRDILVVKYRADGSFEWASRFGGPGQDIGYSVQQTRDGGYVIGAETESVGAQLNLAMLRLDPIGNYMWSRVHEGDTSAEDMIYGEGAGVSVRETELGFVMTGRKRVSATNQMGVVIGTSAAGAPMFNFRYGDSRFNELTQLGFTDIRVARDGTLYVVGAEIMNNVTGVVGVDPILLRLTPAGAPIFARNYTLAASTGVEKGVGDGLDICENGDIVFDGRTDIFGAGSTNIQAFRTDPAGAIRWVKVLPRDGSAYRSIHQDRRGEIALAGWKVGTAGGLSGNGLLVVLNPLTGVPLWEMEYDYLSKANGMVPTPLSDGYALCGTVSLTAAAGSFGGLDIELIHTNDDGRVGCLDRPLDPVFVTPACEPIPWSMILQQQAGTIWQGQFLRWTLLDKRLCSPCPRCPADFNEDGGIDGADVGAFFEAWENGRPCADVNEDGGIDGADVGAFFGLWEAGGC